MRNFFVIAILILIGTPVFTQNPIVIKQAEEGNLDSQKYLAEKYFDGDIGYDKNYQLSFKYYKLAANQGDSDSQFWVFYMLYEGIGTDKNENEAINWLKKSADQNNQQAILRLGVYYFDKKEYSMALPILTKYKELFKEDPLCFELLGRINFAQNNFNEAFFYLNNAINYPNYISPSNGELDALLGFLYENGLGTNCNYKQAEKLFKDALRKNDKDVRFWTLLGELYLLGLNDSKNAKMIWEIILSLNPDARTMNSKLSVAMGGSIDYFIPKNDINNPSTYAIVIANENYKRVPNVPFAHNDGDVFRKYLISSLGIPEENIEYLEDASLNDIKYALANVTQRCNAFREQVSIIVYYAGHGVPDEKTGEAFLLPVDGFGTDPSSGLNLDDFYATLSEMPAKSIVVLLDACFSGAKRDGGMLMATRGITIKPKMHVPDGKLIVLSATSNDETAFPIEQQKHGLFTYTLLRKIQESGGDITWGELADYVTETVKNRSIDLNGKLQSPTVSVSSSMKEIWRDLKLR